MSNVIAQHASKLGMANEKNSISKHLKLEQIPLNVYIYASIYIYTCKVSKSAKNECTGLVLAN